MIVDALVAQAAIEARSRRWMDGRRDYEAVRNTKLLQIRRGSLVLVVQSAASIWVDSLDIP